jgi:hypothetical protein
MAMSSLTPNGSPTDWGTHLQGPLFVGYGEDAPQTSGVLVYDVRAFGAKADGSVADSALINAVLAQVPSAGGIVYFPGGAYTATSPWLVKSNTTLWMSPHAIVTRAFTATVQNDPAYATIRNADQSAGNSNITILGGQLTKSGTSIGQQYGFKKVDNLVMRDFAVTDVYLDWMVCLSDCTHVKMRDFSLTGGAAAIEDGLHIEGGSKMEISQFCIESGDDAIVLAQESNYATTDLTDVEITNGYASSALACMVRILSDSSQTPSARAIRRITLANVTGSASGNAASQHALQIQDNVGGKISDITLKTIRVDASGMGASSGSGMEVFGGTRMLFDDVVINAPYATGINLQAPSYTTVRECHVYGTRGTAPSMNFDTGSASNVKIKGGFYVGGTAHGIVIVGTNGLTNIEFSGVTVLNAIGDGLRLTHVTDAQVNGCTINSNSGWGVNIAATVTRARLTNNTLTSNTSGAITDAGSGTVSI